MCRSEHMQTSLQQSLVGGHHNTLRFFHFRTWVCPIDEQRHEMNAGLVLGPCQVTYVFGRWLVFLEVLRSSPGMDAISSAFELFKATSATGSSLSNE